MQKKITEPRFETWFSTYGLLTVERILEYFSIKLPHDELVDALANEDHVIHIIIRVPVRNIFNGIIFQQAYDYQVYAQKLMIDYRLSPEYAKEPDSPGANVREDLNEQYDQLLSLVKAFTDHQFLHYRTISESQGCLIEHVSQFSHSINQLEILRDHIDFNEKINEYAARSEEMTISFRDYRAQFYNIILTMSERLASLPDYKFDLVEAEKERESLFFDKEIGEE